MPIAEKRSQIFVNERPGMNITIRYHGLCQRNHFLYNPSDTIPEEWYCEGAFNNDKIKWILTGLSEMWIYLFGISMSYDLSIG